MKKIIFNKKKYTKLKNFECAGTCSDFKKN